MFAPPTAIYTHGPDLSRLFADDASLRYLNQVEAQGACYNLFLSLDGQLSPLFYPSTDISLPEFSVEGYNNRNKPL
jgi:hypothetical protein